MPAWDKRVRSLTLHGVEQNMKLGARYFRFEVLESKEAGVFASRVLEATQALDART